MIEATCAACGTVNRIAEADVPVGTKFVSCTSCKSKVALPSKAATPPVPPRPGAQPGKSVAIPAMPKLPTPAKGVPAAAKSDALDLADLPAPKRLSPLAGTEAPPPKPMQRSALTAAELPAPKATAKPPVPQTGSLDLDDLMPPEAGSFAGLADLPAPKPKASALGDLPAPKSPQKSALADLPAPKRKTPAAGVPSEPALADLPAPKRKTPAAGVPTHPPKSTPMGGVPALPPKSVPAAAPKAPALTDLPTPKKPGADLTDLPAPKRGSTGITDLPAPKASLQLDDLDLPMPKDEVTDLPAPKPGANNDYLAPKGFFEDLPQPAKKPAGDIDLPAPKGFFDDLPQPVSSGAKTQDLAPKGFFDDLPQPAPGGGKTQDLAPKGFFDDLPQPAKPKTQDLAPKGFFDDLPQPAGPKTQELAPRGTAAQKPAAQKPAPKGLFDDLPEPEPVEGGSGLFDDLQEPAAKSPANAALGAGDIDLGPATGGPSLELDTDGPELDLGLPVGQDQAFQDLDLSSPTTGAAAPVDEPSPIKIKTPAKGAEKKPIQIVVPPPKGGDMKLDLADDPHHGKGSPAAVATGGPRIAAKKKAAVAEDSAEGRAAKRKRSRVLLGSLLAVVALGGGGFYFYQRHAAAQAKAEEIASNLTKAEKALKADDATHWTRARNAADEAIKLDATNPRALGLAAEAAIAGAIDTGFNSDVRIAQGRGMIQDALGAGRTSPEIERAQALAAITAKGQAQRAVDLIKAQIGKNPKDGWLHLYLGWAQLAKGDGAEAVKAFDQAIALAPGTKLPALYGQGKAKLVLADVAGAQKSFATILETAKDHVCAQIGLIATEPPEKASQQVAELEAVLQRKDIDKADPRCRVQAITLIGDVQRTAGRLDAARQRYRDALKLVPLDQATHNGLAAVELRENKLTVAADHIQKALAVNAEHPETQMLQAELQIREGRLPESEKTIEKLSTRQPPLAILLQARLHIVKGRLLEAKGEHVAAADAFVEGAKLAGELDLAPTMAAVTKLAELAAKETDAGKAQQYRARADQLLSGFAQRAQEDGQLAMALGSAYLQAGDAVKAELYLRRAVALRDELVEAKVALAKALNAQKKTDEALTQLKAAQQLEPKSTEIALELARTYQTAGRHDEAVAAYDKLLAAPDVAIIVRVNAGKYFAQRGLLDKASAQAKPILEAEPQNAGGLYLKSEGLIKAGKPEEAVPLLVKATDIDPDAQYLDALGRAYEGRYRKNNDSEFIEPARFAYERASKADPTMFHPWLGQGRVLVARKDWDPAVKPLVEASQLNKDHAEVKYYLGVAYFGLRNQSAPHKKNSALWLESALNSQPRLELALRAEASWMLGQLYNDLNNAANASRSLENATNFGEEIEKLTGKPPPWLTETYYELGDLYYKLGNSAQQARVWKRYVERKPAPGVRKTTAEQALRTSLQRYN